LASNFLRTESILGVPMSAPTLLFYLLIFGGALISHQELVTQSTPRCQSWIISRFKLKKTDAFKNDSSQLGRLTIFTKLKIYNFEPKTVVKWTGGAGVLLKVLTTD
jgi:hypothetical protein